MHFYVPCILLPTCFFSLLSQVILIPFESSCNLTKFRVDFTSHTTRISPEPSDSKPLFLHTQDRTPLKRLATSAPSLPGSGSGFSLYLFFSLSVFPFCWIFPLCSFLIPSSHVSMFFSSCASQFLSLRIISLFSSHSSSL